MPLHKIFAPPSLYSKQDKKDFAAAITSFYSSFLPEFYVVVLFPRVEEEDFFIGSQTHSDRAREAKPFVRWQVEHLAKQSVGAQERAGLMTKLEQIGKPFLADRNFDWEVTVGEPEKDLWKISGHFPPIVGDKDLEAWNEAKKPLPRTT